MHPNLHVERNRMVPSSKIVNWTTSKLKRQNKRAKCNPSFNKKIDHVSNEIGTLKNDSKAANKRDDLLEQE